MVHFKLVYSCDSITKIFFVLAILLLPAAVYLPEAYFFENHAVENLQAIVLAYGFFRLLNAHLRERRVAVRPLRDLRIAAVTLYFIMVCRELSWGRAFYQVGMTDSGPVFIARNQLWYGEYIHVILGAGIVFCLFLIGRAFISMKKSDALIFPAIELALFGVMALASDLVFEKGAIAALKPYAQQLEEGAELLAYLCLCRITEVSIGRRRRDKAIV